MRIDKADRPAWTRRGFVRAVLATGGAVALGAYAHRGMLSAFAAADPEITLDTVR